MLKDATPGPKTDLRRDMEDIVGWYRTVYRMGTRGLERSLARNGMADPLLSCGLTLVVSDYARHDVRAMMETAADGNYHRACVAVEVLRAKGSRFRGSRRRTAASSSNWRRSTMGVRDTAGAARRGAGLLGHNARSAPLVRISEKRDVRWPEY